MAIDQQETLDWGFCCACGLDVDYCHKCHKGYCQVTPEEALENYRKFKSSKTESVANNTLAPSSAHLSPA